MAASDLDQWRMGLIRDKIQRGTCFGGDHSTGCTFLADDCQYFQTSHTFVRCSFFPNLAHVLQRAAGLRGRPAAVGRQSTVGNFRQSTPGLGQFYSVRVPCGAMLRNGRLLHCARATPTSTVTVSSCRSYANVTKSLSMLTAWLLLPRAWLILYTHRRRFCSRRCGEWRTSKSLT
eukprot:1179735-Prorocentrum_minimum.AAC.1